MDLNMISTILIGLFILSVLIDPFLIFLLVAAVFEYQLKKRLPDHRLRGIALFEYALSHGDDSILRLAKRGVIAQLAYCVLWCVAITLVIALFLYQDLWAMLVLTVAFAFFTWFAYRFWRLLLKCQ